jgi:hypothetical protein
LPEAQAGAVAANEAEARWMLPTDEFDCREPVSEREGAAEEEESGTRGPLRSEQMAAKGGVPGQKGKYMA